MEAVRCSTAPLPASAQFLNLIETAFSGMARAIIRKSDYRSVDEAKGSIPRMFGLFPILRGTSNLIYKSAKLGGLLLKLIEPQAQNVANADHANKASFLFHWEVPNISRQHRRCDEPNVVIGGACDYSPRH